MFRNPSTSCIELSNPPDKTASNKKTAGDQNSKPMIAAKPSLPKEEPRKKLVDTQDAAKKELEALRQALLDEKAKSNEYMNRLKYLQADFENSTRRLKKEAEEAARLGNERLILGIIEVMENLERAVEAGEKMGEKSELTTGVGMILKQLNEILRQEGLEAISTEGKRFDPTLHEALAQTETEEKAEGTIIKELKRGYTYRGRVLRPSKVEVAKKPASKEQS
jgi:molecular chaperone GrpE